MEDSITLFDCLRDFLFSSLICSFIPDVWRCLGNMHFREYAQSLVWIGLSTTTALADLNGDQCSMKSLLVAEVQT